MRTLTTDGLRELLSRASSAAWLELVTIGHADLASDIRLVNNTEDVTYDGNVYTAFPFTLALPPDVEDRIPEVNIIFDNVSREMTEPFRTISSPPSVSLSIVMVLPNQAPALQAGPWDFVLRAFSMDAMSISGTIAQEVNYLDEPRSKIRFEPLSFPGMFQ